MLKRRCEMPLEMYWKRLPRGDEVLEAKRFCKREASEIVEVGYAPPKELCREHAELLRKHLETHHEGGKKR